MFAPSYDVGGANATRLEAYVALARRSPLTKQETRRAIAIAHTLLDLKRGTEKDLIDGASHVCNQPPIVEFADAKLQDGVEDGLARALRRVPRPASWPRTPQR